MKLLQLEKEIYLFILTNLDMSKYKLNFDWTDEEIEYWGKFFEVQI